MSIIKVEKLSKKYILSHLQRESYTALRDVISEKVKTIGRKVLHPFTTHHSPYTNSSQEEFWALKDVSFEINQGDRVGIIGRNGAGKSTLLKILSRITEPTTGSIKIKGRVASLLEVGTGFHPELTGRENIFLNGAILGMGRAEIKKKFDEIVDFAEIDRFLDTPVKRYSSGMYVRLAFAVAAHLEPEILVVDEVLAVGDTQFQKKCLGKMEDVGKEGRTVLFVSHNINAINNLCQKAMLLSAGQLVCQGNTADVVTSYLNLAEVNTSASAEFPDDPNKPYQIFGFSIRASDGTLLDGPQEVEKPIILNLQYKLAEPLPGGYAVISLKNQSGEIVLFLDNRDNRESVKFDEPGIIRTTIHIPAPLLVPGRYTVSASIARPPLGTIDVQLDVISFEVEDTNGIRKNRPGYIFLPLEWAKE
jgi:lipopolysaccharide transport system ATP-binding protein